MDAIEYGLPKEIYQSGTSSPVIALYNIYNPIRRK